MLAVFIPAWEWLAWVFQAAADSSTVSQEEQQQQPSIRFYFSFGFSVHSWSSVRKFCTVIRFNFISSSFAWYLLVLDSSQIADPTRTKALFGIYLFCSDQLGTILMTRFPIFSTMLLGWTGSSSKRRLGSCPRRYLGPNVELLSNSEHERFKIRPELLDENSKWSALLSHDPDDFALFMHRLVTARWEMDFIPHSPKFPRIFRWKWLVTLSGNETMAQNPFVKICLGYISVSRGLE